MQNNTMNWWSVLHCLFGVIALSIVACHKENKSESATVVVEKNEVGEVAKLYKFPSLYWLENHLRPLQKMDEDFYGGENGKARNSEALLDLKEKKWEKAVSLGRMLREQGKSRMRERDWRVEDDLAERLELNDNEWVASQNIGGDSELLAVLSPQKHARLKALIEEGVAKAYRFMPCVWEVRVFEDKGEVERVYLSNGSDTKAITVWQNDYKLKMVSRAGSSSFDIEIKGGELFSVTRLKGEVGSHMVSLGTKKCEFKVSKLMQVEPTVVAIESIEESILQRAYQVAGKTVIVSSMINVPPDFMDRLRSCNVGDEHFSVLSDIKGGQHSNDAKPLLEGMDMDFSEDESVMFIPHLSVLSTKLSVRNIRKLEQITAAMGPDEWIEDAVIEVTLLEVDIDQSLTKKINKGVKVLDRYHIETQKSNRNHIKGTGPIEVVQIEYRRYGSEPSFDVELLLAGKEQQRTSYYLHGVSNKQMLIPLSADLKKRTKLVLRIKPKIDSLYVGADLY